MDIAPPGLWSSTSWTRSSPHAPYAEVRFSYKEVQGPDFLLETEALPRVGEVVYTDALHSGARDGRFVVEAVEHRVLRAVERPHTVRHSVVIKLV